MATDLKRVRGTVINVHALGATVRLEDGRLMAVSIGDVNANRATYTRAVDARGATLPFDLLGRTLVLAKTRIDEAVASSSSTSVPPSPAIAPPSPAPIASSPAPVLNDPEFEAQINEYLKATQEWSPPDRPAPFERHLFRKAQRAKLFRGDIP